MFRADIFSGPLRLARAGVF